MKLRLCLAAAITLCVFGAEDTFHITPAGVTEGTGATAKTWPLPQSDFATYARLRSDDVKMNPLSATAGRYEREETIGPQQTEGDKLWFGNNFYDGEGERGVGAFGYFDKNTRQYQIYSPPEVAPYEVSAILVEPDAVWLALDHSGEDISKFPGGLVRWNKSTHQVTRYSIEFVATKIVRDGQALRLTTGGGYALLRNGAISRFQFHPAPDGGLRPVAIARFPDPPTHHQN